MATITTELRGMRVEPVSLDAGRSLLAPQPDPCLSLYLSTHRSVPENTVDRPTYRSLVETLERTLDEGHPRDTVERLLAVADPVDRPIVGGLAFAQKSDGAGPMYARRYRMCPTIYKMHETDNEVGFVPVFDYPRDQVVEVDGTGAACILIHRSVLEKITRESPYRPFDQVTLAKGPKGRTEFGEDLSFCIRAKAAGFPIHVDTSVKTTHDKGAVFLDEETYDLQQAMMARRGLAE